MTVVCAGLAGCADLDMFPPDAVAVAEKACMSGKQPFPDAWGCVQARYASGQSGEPNPRFEAFLRLGDDLAGQVAEKKLSNAEARRRLMEASAG